MKPILNIIAAFLFISFIRCSTDDIAPEIDRDPELSHRQAAFSLTAVMPSNETSSTNPTEARIALEQAGKNILLTWEPGDKLYLVYTQGEETIVKDSVTVAEEDITEEGKKASFNISLPDGIQEGTFNLYGVYGGGGLDEVDPTLAIMPAPNLSDNLDAIQENEEVMLYFKATGINTANLNTTVTFQHVGSLFSITLNNVGSVDLSNLGGIRLVAETGGWAYNFNGGGEFNITTGEFTVASSAGSYIDFKSEATVLNQGESITLWGWYPPLPDVNWPALRLQLLDEEGNPVHGQSSNSKPARQSATLPGKAFHLYAEWNGSSVYFEDEGVKPLVVDNFESGMLHPRFRSTTTNGIVEIVSNPSKSGINTSDKVLRITKSWASQQLNIDIKEKLNADPPFDVVNKGYNRFRFKYYTEVTEERKVMWKYNGNDQFLMDITVQPTSGGNVWSYAEVEMEPWQMNDLQMIHLRLNDKPGGGSGNETDVIHIDDLEFYSFVPAEDKQ